MTSSHVTRFNLVLTVASLTGNNENKRDRPAIKVAGGSF